MEIQVVYSVFFFYDDLSNIVRFIVLPIFIQGTLRSCPSYTALYITYLPEPQPFSLMLDAGHWRSLQK